MKRFNRWMLAALGAAGAVAWIGAATAAEVELGASRDDVIDKLGEPPGMAQMGDTEVLYYPRGQVDLEDGIVVRSSVLSKEEYQAEQERLAKEAEARRKAAEEAAASRTEEGRKRLQAIKENDSLANRSPADRLAYWRDFQKRYPEVDVQSEIRSAQAAVNQQKEAAAAFERKVQEEMAKPPPGLSGSKLRRYRRGRSESAIQEREAEIRERLKQEAGQGG